MKYEPKTEEQLDNEMLVPDGTYDFEVTDAEEKATKKGDPMIALKLRVFDGNGSPRVQRDWLIGNGHPMCIRKIKHFCDTTGLDYEGGELSAEVCIGRSGLVQLDHADSEEYGPQNRVADYKTENPTETREKAPRGVPAGQTKTATSAAAGSDDIPF